MLLDPVLDDFLVTMIKDSGFETFLLVKDDKSIIFRVFVIFDLVNIEAFQRNYVGRENLVSVVINVN